MNQSYYTFTFLIDPRLNSGFGVAFNQGGEPWWHYEDNREGFPQICTGNCPNLEGATLLSVHDGNKLIHGQEFRNERS